MQWQIIALLVLVIALITNALILWRRDGWKARKHLIVMLIVLAAAAQLVNLVLVARAQSPSQSSQTLSHK